MSRQQILGFGDERSEAIAEWICEFEENCSRMRGIALASQLGEALESYLGIDKDILTEAFLRTTATFSQQAPYAIATT